MKRMIRESTIGLTLAAVLAAPLALAQQPLPPRGPMTFWAFDLDGDGIVTEQEFDTVHAQRMAERAALGIPMRGAATAPTFAQFDLNGDGRLTPEEYHAVQRSRMQMRPGAGMGPGQGMGPGPGMGPGQGMGPGARMSPGTATGPGPGMGPGMGMGPPPGGGMGRHMPTFAEFDLNGDGVLTEQELAEARAKRIAERSQQGYAMRNLENAPSFGALDLNGDGQITPEEFAAGQAQRHQQR